MIDTHCHIDGVEFDNDRNELLERAKAIGISHLIIPAIEPKRFDKLWEVVNSDDFIYCGFGVHPHNASEYNDEVEKIILNKITDENTQKVVAVGEIGLDYYYDFAPKDVQKDAFFKQLLIAKQYDKPVIVHNRESDSDILEFIQNASKSFTKGELIGVLHCFSSDLDVLKKALDLGFNVSFTGNVTFKKSTLDEVVKYVPNDRYMIETDSPYITPVPYRGKRNEPSYVHFVAEKIAEIKQLKLEDIINQTTENAMKLFKLPLLMLFIFVTISIVNINNSFAQIQVTNQSAVIQTEEEVVEDEEYIEEEFENPYKRNIGFGPFLGPNTIVVTEYYPEGRGPNGIDEVDRSYEGFAFFGGSFQYSPLDYLILEGSYYTSKNSNPVSESVPGRKPDYYSGLEISSLWIANPSKRINFFGGGGVSYFMNNLDGVASTALGLNFSIGFIGNINLESAGLLNLVVQWKFVPRFGRQDITVLDPNRKLDNHKTIDIQASQFFSMPRFSLIWHPNF